MISKISFIKYINIFALTSLLLCSSNYALGQSRNTKTDTPSIQTQSEKLRESVGWKQDALGSWISNKNAISDTKITDRDKHTVPQNFKWLQFALLKNGNQNIYALVYESEAYILGDKNERRVYYFLMTEKSYATILSTIANKNGETLTVHSSSFGYMSDNDGVYTAEKLLKLIGQSILGTESAFRYDFSINAQHVDNADVVRFLLPEKSSIINTGLKESYFETPLASFSRTLLPLSIQVEPSEFDLGSIPKVNTPLTKNMIQPGNDEIIDRNGSDAKAPQKVDFELTNANQTNTPTEFANVIAEEPKEKETTSTDGIGERSMKEKAIVSAPIAMFSGIDGWYFNSEGEWVADKSLSYNFETIGKYEMRNLKYHGKDYLIITRFEKYAGSSFYLLAKDEYVKALTDLEKNSIIRFPLITYAKVGHTLEDMIEISENAIDAPVKEHAIIYKNNYLVLQYKLSASKNIARFFIYLQECSKYGSETSKESCNAKVSNKIKYEDESLLGSDVLFNKMYYEGTYNDFMNFLRKPISTTQPSKSGSSNSFELESRY